MKLSPLTFWQVFSFIDLLRLVVNETSKYGKDLVEKTSPEGENASEIDSKSFDGVFLSWSAKPGKKGRKN